MALRLALAAAALLFIVSIVDWQSIAHQGAWLPLVILVGVCISALFVPLLALRWMTLVRVGSTGRLSYLSALRGYFTGIFFNLALPGAIGGDLVRTHHASVHAGIGHARSGLIVVTERLFGLLSICLMAGIGLAMNDRLSAFTTIPRFEVVIALIVVTGVVVGAVAVGRRYIGIPMTLVPLLLLISAIGQSSDLLLVHLYGRFLSVHIPLETLLIVVPLVFIASVLPLVPGGHGAREVTLAGLLALSGVMASEAGLIALMLFLTKIGLGLVGMGFFLHGNRTVTSLASPEPK